MVYWLATRGTVTRRAGSLAAPRDAMQGRAEFDVTFEVWAADPRARSTLVIRDSLGPSMNV